VTEKPGSAGPADEVGNAPTSRIREETDPSCADAVPSVLRELAHAPEVLVESVALAFRTTQIARDTCVGPYKILSRLGRGGMGVVYEAEDVRLGRRVALKFLSADLANDPDALSRFRREARAASALNHPHICTIHDVGEHEGASYLVMELLEGETLLDRLRRGPLPPDEFFDVALAIASALEAAGEKSVVHRDLKPANIFLTRSGAKVLDFGLARIGDATGASPTPTGRSWQEQPTRPGTVMGTLHYMSPEQVRGEPVDARADLFSLGVVLYEMVTGRHPFAASTAGLVADAILNRDPVPPDIESHGFAPGVAGLISRALEKDVSRRYQTTADLREELLSIRITPDLRSSTVSAPAIPVPLGSFVGRVAELRLVKEVLSKARMVTLTGPGGTGKTRLALRAAEESVPGYRDGVYFVPLAAVRDPVLLDSAIAQAVGLREVPDVVLAEHLVRHLAGREILLVLDNFEHVLSAAPRAADLLRSASRLRLLVTSRERLHLSAEVEVPVPPLALPNFSDAAQPGPLLASESVTLFCERAAAVRPGFALSDENATVVAEICTRLDGLPLAIELAAARVRHLTPPALLQRLSRRLAVLTGGARDLPARQQTLRDAIGWSHELLSAEERTLFARLAVFNGGFTLSAAEAVSAAVGPLALDVLDGVASLVDKSLVKPPGAGDEPHYAMLETIREFGLECLAAGGEAGRASAAHAAHYAAFVGEATPIDFHSGRRAAQLERLWAELDNIRAALAWSITDGGDAVLGETIAGRLPYFWITRNLIGEGMAALLAVLARTTPEPTRSRARALRGLGVLYLLRGDYEAATTTYEEALSVCRTLQDERGAALTLGSLSLAAELRGRHAEARRLVTESAAIYRRRGDRLGLANVLVNEIEPDDFAEARRDGEEALAICRACGDAWNASRALHNLGVVAFREGSFAEARRRLEECLALQREIGERWFTVLTLNHLGDLARCEGDIARAETCYQESRDVYRVTGMGATVAGCLTGLGHVMLARGAARRAAALFVEALRARTVSAEKPELVAACLVGLAETRRLGGDLGGAAALLTAATPLVDEARRRMPPVDVASHERCVFAVRGALGEAAYEAALAEAERLGLTEVVRRALETHSRQPEDVLGHVSPAPRRG
jgi:predicted ATPase/serine/threonine protein kinase/Tfp pilus assembly protein PilF